MSWHSKTTELHTTGLKKQAEDFKGVILNESIYCMLVGKKVDYIKIGANESNNKIIFGVKSWLLRNEASSQLCSQVGRVH